MQEFLLAALKRIAEKPTRAEWVAKVAAEKAASPTSISIEEILRHRDADRR